MNATDLGLKERSLSQQGYDFSPDRLRKLDWGLRFTPTLCMLAALYGLLTQQAWVHFTLAALGILPFWFPAAHPLDVFYNLAIRPLWNGVRLPPNPLPRRIACLMGGSMNAIIGLAFVLGANLVAYLFGGILIVLQLVVISTHFCVASWMYEGLLKLQGKWTRPIPPSKARELVDQGACLIDVRTREEFARGHLEGAENIPLDEIGAHVSTIAKSRAVLYCQSGARSQNACQLLKRRGLDQVYNLGAMSRWEPGEAVSSESSC